MAIFFIPTALATSELAFALKLDVDKNFISVRATTALPSKTGTGSIDSAVTEGFQWLTSVIKKQYDSLDQRVQRDVLAAAEAKAREKMRKELAVDV